MHVVVNRIEIISVLAPVTERLKIQCHAMVTFVLPASISERPQTQDPSFCVRRSSHTILMSGLL